MEVFVLDTIDQCRKIPIQLYTGGHLMSRLLCDGCSKPFLQLYGRYTIVASDNCISSNQILKISSGVEHAIMFPIAYLELKMFVCLFTKRVKPLYHLDLTII